VSHWQLAHVVGKRGKRPALEEVLLDVRRVKRRHCDPGLLQIVTDRGERLLAPKVSDDRADQIFRLHRSNKVVVFVAREEVALFAGEVGLEYQILEARKISAVPVAVEPKRNVEPFLEEALVDVLEARLIIF